MGRRSLKTIDVEGVDDLAKRHYAVSGTPSPLRTGSRLREGDHTGGARWLGDLELATLEWVDWFNHRRLKRHVAREVFAILRTLVQWDLALAA